MDTQENKTTAPTVPATPAVAGAAAPRGGVGSSRPPFRGSNRGGTGATGSSFGDKRGGPRRGNSSARTPKPKPEFDHKVISIRRVTRVVAGGKRFNFSVAVVAGNRKGMVGVGLGKGADTALAIDKAMRSAKKNMVTISLTKDMTILHEVYAKYSSGRVMIMPAKGRGVVAGSSVRNVLELAGIKDVAGKILSPSKNKINIARAAVEALKDLRMRRQPAVVATK
ncbi:MAG: 30S ribosomal protein S5 [Candidatus Paceibacterota bacterium]|jgi:small subunit ribosomal protein S5